MIANILKSTDQTILTLLLLALLGYIIIQIAPHLGPILNLLRDIAILAAKATAYSCIAFIILTFLIGLRATNKTPD